MRTSLSFNFNQKMAAFGFFAVAFMVFTMVIIGGLTRLTGSGLSMVEWKPLTGFMPPLSDMEWMNLFAQYQKFPEFSKINYTMDLEGFKKIFWLEYIHRVWGRLIGLVLLIPTYFVLKDAKCRQTHLLPLMALWIFGSSQGLLGWYMVKSGLLSDPHVSPYRLSAHLIMAFLLLKVSLSAGLKFFNPHTPSPKYKKRLSSMIALTLLTATFGGFVAGLKAGLIYNTFPLMNGEWIPEDIWFLDPLWKNFVENPSTVQFIHRFLATLTVLFITGGLYSLRPLPDRSSKYICLGVLMLILSQFFLGVLTLLHKVPLLLASFHQAMALMVFMGLIVLQHKLTENLIKFKPKLKNELTSP